MMASSELLKSKDNPSFKTWSKLHDRKYRNRFGCFLVEGARELSHLLMEPGFKIDRIGLCPDWIKPKSEAFLQKLIQASENPPLHFSPNLFDKLSLRENSDGYLACVKILPKKAIQGFIPSEQSCILVLDGIEKPGNFGAIVRSADAFGAEAILLTGNIPDPFNPNVIRNSQGLVFRVPIYESSADDLTSFLKIQAYRLYLTRPDAENNLWQTDFAARSALFMGSEDRGLSSFWEGQALRIPQFGQADSLNVSVASAVVLSEIARQRHHKA